MITSLFLAAAAAYFLELLWLLRGLVRADRARRAPAFEPTVSVVVAARNEEDRIAECLATLVTLDYPASKLEILVVDDRSTDRTGEIIDGFARQHPSIRKIVSGTPKGNLRGKANALFHGIAVSTGEILMFTDADCRVKPSWVRSTVGFFDESTGVVGGFTLLDARGPFQGMQQLDWMFLFGIASSAAGWGLPLTAIGNNLSVRRAAYLAAGGYEGIPFSVTEDYALVQAILRSTPYGVQFPMNPSGVVSSKACANAAQLFRQKQRWGVGGLDMVLRGLIIMAVGWVYRAFFLAGCLVVDPLIFISTALVILALEMLYLAMPLKEFGSLSSLRHFPAFQAYYLPYVLLMPLIAMLSKNVVWKERTLTKAEA